MNLTKHFLKEVLDETVQDFNGKITEIGNRVELTFVEREDFISSAMEDPLIRYQVQLGVYKNLEKEYPNFVKVYGEDSRPMMKWYEVPYKISICSDLAKDILKPYSKTSVRDYLKRVFAVELARIVKGKLVRKYPDLWSQHLEEANNHKEVAMEKFIEAIADRIGNIKEYEQVKESIWSVIHSRMDRLQKNNSGI